MEPQEQKRQTTEQILGDFGFVLRWSVLDHWANVEVFEIGARGDAGPEFRMKETEGCGMIGFTPDMDKAEVYLDGFVKWDGCTELNMGQPHWCGAGGYENHILLLAHIYKRAFELMGREPEDEWTLQITQTAKE